jgi:eukaryotic-like serine/threonine-protein kinase
MSGTPLEITLHQLKDPPPSLQGKMPIVPVEMERVLMKALSKEPKQRFATMNEFARAMAQGSLDSPGGKSLPS